MKFLHKLEIIARNLRYWKLLSVKMAVNLTASDIDKFGTLSWKQRGIA